jgi:hypothetical protein
MEHLPFSPDLALNDFWLFPKMKSALKGRRFCDDSTERYSTAGIPKMFPTVASGINGLNAR